MSQSSIVHGGFDRDAAESILQLDSFSDCPPIVDVLQELCDNSLLSITQSLDGTIRYGQLESVRQYANAKLTVKESAAVGIKQAAFYAQYGSDNHLLTDGEYGSYKKLLKLAKELENLVVASVNGTPETAALCCLAAIQLFGM